MSSMRKSKAEKFQEKAASTTSRTVKGRNKAPRPSMKDTKSKKSGQMPKTTPNSKGV